MDSVRDPIWLTFSSSALHHLPSMPCFTRFGLVTSRSSPTTCAEGIGRGYRFAMLSMFWAAQRILVTTHDDMKASRNRQLLNICGGAGLSMA